MVWSKYLTSIQNDQNYCLKVKTLGKYGQVDVENAGWNWWVSKKWAEKSLPYLAWKELRQPAMHWSLFNLDKNCFKNAQNLQFSMRKSPSNNFYFRLCLLRGQPF